MRRAAIGLRACASVHRVERLAIGDCGLGQVSARIIATARRRADAIIDRSETARADWKERRHTPTGESGGLQHPSA